MKLEPIYLDSEMKVLKSISKELLALSQNLKVLPTSISLGTPIRIPTDAGYVNFSKPFVSSMRNVVWRIVVVPNKNPYQSTKSKKKKSVS